MTRYDERLYWLALREQIMVKMLRENQPSSHIAVAVGLEYDNARKLSRCLAKRYGIDYQPRVGSEPVDRLSDENRLVRRRMADALYMLRQWRHPLEIAIATGIPQRHQRRACDPPYNHNWSWAEMVGFARLLDVTFGELTIALGEDENAWQRWLHSLTVAQHREKVLSAA